MERVKTLLLKEDIPLATMASELGFVDQSHLTRVFKRMVGMTPHAFLQQQSKNISWILQPARSLGHLPAIDDSHCFIAHYTNEEDLT
jgi:AraC-like DNA-binding protein